MLLMLMLPDFSFQHSREIRPCVRVHVSLCPPGEDDAERKTDELVWKDTTLNLGVF